MKIVVLDDYQGAVTGLDSFALLAGQEVVVYTDIVQDEEQLVQRLSPADALVLIRERTKMTERLLARLPRLKLISQTGRGVAHIDVAACSQHGVAVAVGGGEPFAPAELTWALILAAVRRLPQEVANMKQGNWQVRQPVLGHVLRGRTLGIWGYGKIGRVVAQYGRAFGMDVLVWGREGSLARASADGFATAAGGHELLHHADVLSLHLSLNAQTRGLLTAADLAKMKPSALLVNTSRAGLIAPGALAAALGNGRPGYAAVDVYEEEPVVDDPLLRMDNVICTPHIGYVEKDTYELYFRQAFTNLLAFFAGRPANVINAPIGGK
jgi:D-3-phosphoglycerate dehydrogenase